MTTTDSQSEPRDGAELNFDRGRFRWIAALLIVCAIAGAVGCVVADVV